MKRPRPGYAPPKVHLLAEDPDRFLLVKHDGTRSYVQVMLSRPELEELLAAGRAVLDKTAPDAAANEAEEAKIDEPGPGA